MMLARTKAVAAVTLGLVVALTGTVPVSAEAAAKPHRNISGKVVKRDSGSLQYRAHVQNYPRGYIALMKKNCKTCAWNRIAIRRTTDYGRAFFHVGAPRTGRWYYRVRTPETRRFATSYGPTYYTYRF